MTRLVVALVGLVGLVAASSANAAPLHQLVIDVELDKLDTDAMSQQPLRWALEEPGGMIVPPEPNASWKLLGLRAGDVIVRDNGAPAHKSPVYMSEGTEIFDIVRDGKPMQLRVVLHGAAHRSIDVDDSDVHFIERYSASHARDPIVVPVTWNGVVSGVRVVDDLPHVSLMYGDLVRSIGATPIHSNDDLLVALESLPVGDSDMTLDRDGRTIVVTLQRKPPIDVSGVAQLAPNVFEVPSEVARAIAHDPELLTSHARFTRGARGIDIVSIDPKSVLAVGGLRDGDTIIDINGEAIDWDADDLHREAFQLYYRAWRKKTPITLHVWRGGKQIAIVYQLPRKT